MPITKKFTAYFLGGPRDGAKDAVAFSHHFLYCGRVEDGIWPEWAHGRARYDLHRIDGDNLIYKFIDYENHCNH